MKVYLESIKLGLTSRKLLGEGDTLDDLYNIKNDYLLKNYNGELNFDRYWMEDMELVNDFGSKDYYIIFSELTIDVLKELPIG